MYPEQWSGPGFPKAGPGEVPEELFPEVGCAQWVGTRKLQNDVIRVHVKDAGRGQMLTVADGIGLDEAAGEAATMAADTVWWEFDRAEPANDPNQLLLYLIGKAHKKLLGLNEEAQARGEMPTGAALAVVLVRNRRAVFASIGNVRVFLLRSGALLQLSRDHLLSLEAEERDILADKAPDLEPDWALRVTAYAGMDGLKQVDWQSTPITLQKNDQLVILSSGLYGALPEQELVQLLTQMPPQEAADAVIARVRARTKGSQSNASISILRLSSRRRRGQTTDVMSFPVR